MLEKERDEAQARLENRRWASSPLPSCAPILETDLQDVTDNRIQEALRKCPWKIECFLEDLSVPDCKEEENKIITYISSFLVWLYD